MIFHRVSGSQSTILLIPGKLGGSMAKHILNNQPLGILLFMSTFCMSLTINWGQAIHQKAIAYEAHEFVFISRLPNLPNMNQQQADSVCNNNFNELRQVGIFDESVQKNTWHIWAHVKNGDCVINIRNWSGATKDPVYWHPSNNPERTIEVRVPKFN
ncbi:MAG: hypothetical protein EAZ73_30575 [Oscillatoriales cyanobacterium]|nr:MAG: hypothetical protein EAZ83_30745 [Oscillatoriales cyanobacterium]TAF13176.1 MAG: hypothetical protein EAZ73_30575 [Oscillatoriales cyanobacterium]